MRRPTAERRARPPATRAAEALTMLLGALALGAACGGSDGERATAEPRLTHPVVDVAVDDATRFRLENPSFPRYTGDLWPTAWGADDRLYTANGDGFGFGLIPSDVVVSVIDGLPPDLVGSGIEGAYGKHVAGLWGPYLEVNRKPTGMTCVDGDLYLFSQNLKTGFTEDPFGDAPHGSISVSRDGGATWEFDGERPMFTDHVFTTGFFADFGRCDERARDGYVYVYGLDYNWRYSDDFDQEKLYLARVPRDRILDRDAWTFFTSVDPEGRPRWSSVIEAREPVLVDEESYCGRSGVSQGSVVHLPAVDRYLYSTRSLCAWIFWEAPEPWGPWTRVGVKKWKGKWGEDYHAGYNAVIPSKFLDRDGRGGWLLSSLSSSTFDGDYYNLNFRRFELATGPPSLVSAAP